jgi:hypothetical protein
LWLKEAVGDFGKRIDEPTVSKSYLFAVAACKSHYFLYLLTLLYISNEEGTRNSSEMVLVSLILMAKNELISF